MSKDICNDDSLTPEEKWERIYGTESIGNLPEFKANQHVGRCFSKCPYSTQATERRTRLMLGIESGGALPDRVNHVDEQGIEYFMEVDHKGEWGYTCTYSGCPYLLTNGKKYFYR